MTRRRVAQAVRECLANNGRGTLLRVGSAGRMRHWLVHRSLSRHRAHATVIVDTESDVVLRHAQAEDPLDATLAVQLRVLDPLANSRFT